MMQIVAFELEKIGSWYKVVSYISYIFIEPLYKVKIPKAAFRIYTTLG